MIVNVVKSEVVFFFSKLYLCNKLYVCLLSYLAGMSVSGAVGMKKDKRQLHIFHVSTQTPCLSFLNILLELYLSVL